MSMHMYYWEDPGGCGYDFVVQAENVEKARAAASKSYDGSKELEADVFAGLNESPTGMFHYEAALCLFTEHDPVDSRFAKLDYEEFISVSEETGLGPKQLAEERTILRLEREQVAEQRTREREELARFIISFGSSTGHGDTIHDLLTEFGAFLDERRAERDQLAERVKELERMIVAYPGTPEVTSK